MAKSRKKGWLRLIRTKCGGVSRGTHARSYHTDRGFAALVTVVIIGAATLLMAYNATLLGLGELDMGFTSQRGSEAFSVADGCMEETLRRIRIDTVYGVGSGTINLTVSNGSCILDVTDLGGGQRRLVVTGTSGSYNKKLQVELTLTGNVISIDSWAELST